MRPDAKAAEPSASWRALSRRLMGEPTMTSAELAARTGYPAASAKRLWAALGLPPVPEHARAFGEADAAVIAAVRRIAEDDVDGIETVVQVARVVGRAMARIAEACVAAAGDRAARHEPTEPADAAIERAVEALEPTLAPVLLHVWRHHLVAAVLRATEVPGDARDRPVQVVGFADLVGFTALGRRLEAGELTALVDRFEALAYERIVSRGGRVVKMIGDEVMFTADDPAVAADIALALAEAPARERLIPPLRVGLAVGPTLPWQGDLFGTTVNLASRLVDIARPGTVLASDALGERLDSTAFDLRHLRALDVKGLGRVRSWVVRRPSAGRG